MVTNRIKRNFIDINKDFDVVEYLIPTSIYEEDQPRFERLLRIYEENNPEFTGSFRCQHEHDCCGCLCSRYVDAVSLFGRVYIAVTESYNY